jgi:putative oxidoreductase
MLSKAKHPSLFINHHSSIINQDAVFLLRYGRYPESVNSFSLQAQAPVFTMGQVKTGYGLAYKLLKTSAPAATIFVRILVGGVFLAEGIQKFLFADQLGVGRFVRIGIPFPQLTAPFVGFVEIVFGMLLIVGLLTRLAAVVLLINISVAIVSTKVPMLLGHGFWGFSLAKLPRYGFWAMVHEARTDFCMWLGCLFLIIVGAGYISLDYLIALTGKKPAQST